MGLEVVLDIGDMSYRELKIYRNVANHGNVIRWFGSCLKLPTNGFTSSF